MGQAHSPHVGYSSYSNEMASASPAPSNIQASQIRGHRARIRNRSPRRPLQMNNNNNPRTRVDAPSSCCNEQNLNQGSGSRDVGSKRGGCMQSNEDTYENGQDTENNAHLSNDAERRLVSTLDPIETNNSKKLYEINTKVIISTRTQSSSKPLLQFDNPFCLPSLIPPKFSAPTADAKKIANHLIKLSRYLKTPKLHDLCCLDCRQIPVLPVTGQCGHTRCMSCIVDNGACRCGTKAPENLFVNTVVREITETMVQYIKNPRKVKSVSSAVAFDNITYPLIGDDQRHLLNHRDGLSLPQMRNSSAPGLYLPRMPMSVQARYRNARHLMATGNFLEAAAHLARVAASSEPFSRSARILLTQAVSALCNKRQNGSASRLLRQSVREQAAPSWLRPADLECVLCTSPYACPVSTPCGHTYCRQCIEHSLHYSRRCALCLATLKNFYVPEIRDTVFIKSILSSIDVIPLPEETNVIPIVTCHVAYPGMPFPLFVFKPRCCQMIQRVLASGSRRFGMLGHHSPNYGTVLEIRDCIVFEDKRCIVSTIGISRFRIIESYKSNGIEVGRIQRLTDIELSRKEVERAQWMAPRVHRHAMCWLRAMSEHTGSVREEIHTAFGSLPDDLDPTALGNSPDGPYWLWWLIAILPLKQDIKTMILTTRSLLKRLTAAAHALEVIESDARTRASANDLSSSE